MEGPTVEKLGDRYLIYFDEYKKFSFGAIATKDFIHFSNVSKEVSVPKDHKHGTIFKASASIIDNLIKISHLSQIQKTDSTTTILSAVK